MRLSDLCDIRSGYSARTRLDPVAWGGVPALTLGDVVADAWPDAHTLRQYDLPGLADESKITGGEVLFRARGVPSTALVVPPALDKPVAVVLPLVILRPDPSRIQGDYLAWAINHPTVQRQIEAAAQGSGTRIIPLGLLGAVDLPVPSLALQARIARVAALVRQERQLMTELAVQRALLSDLILGAAARHAHHLETTP